MDVAAPEFVILPTPAKAAHVDGPPIDLKAGAHLAFHGIRSADIAPAIAAFRRDVPLAKDGLELAITADPAMPPEAYRITAKGGVIAITAADAAGASYALRSSWPSRRLTKNCA